MDINDPVFIVGCPRSGTTLLQSVVATNENFFTLPEVGFLAGLSGQLDLRRFGPEWLTRKRVWRQRKKGWFRRAGVVTKFDWRRVNKNLAPELEALINAKKLGREYFLRSICGRFADMMDELADGRRWVEKTPDNIFALDYLERYFPNAIFLHIVRSRTANIASLIDAGRKYDTFHARFGGQYGLERSISYYNNALSVSISRQNSKRHLIIRYESLTNDTDASLRQVESFLSIGESTLAAIYDTSNIALPVETWKQSKTHVSQSADKATSIFTEFQIKTIQHNAFDPDKCLTATRNVFPQ